MDLNRHIDTLTNHFAPATVPTQEIDPFEQWLPQVSPHLVWNAPHHELICRHLERVTSGELRRLMIFLPPQHGKSELVTVHYSAWTIERSPRKRVIVGSYSAQLAENFSRRARSICASRTTLSDERSAVSDWETSRGGGLRAVGVGGGITGRGGDLIIIDDPVEGREEANSQTMRDRAWNWLTDDIATRQGPGAAIIVIMTRWHEDDLAGRILTSDEAKEWTVVSLPALAETNDPLGRLEGAALWPARYDEGELARRKAMLGSSFQALYQQRPSALEGEIFKRTWWGHYREAPEFRLIVQSWDTAFKTGTTNDFSVCTTWGVAGNGFYLIDVWKRRVEFPELKAMVAALGEQYGPHAVLVEDKASGQSLIQELQRDTRLPILPIKVDSDKVSRAFAVTPTIEAGRVLLPEGAPWVADYVDTMAGFPRVAHDDDVDSTTQALNYLVRMGSGPSIASAGRRLMADAGPTMPSHTFSY